MRPATEGLAAFFGGFIAAEGTFVITGSRPTFRFAVALGATDGAMCELMQRFFGCGRLQPFPRRKPHYDDEIAFTVAAFKDHVEVTVPFMDAHLPVSYKREQYLRWRAQLMEYWEHDAKRVRPCIVEGCSAPRRAHQLCRRHLFAARGV